MHTEGDWQFDSNCIFCGPKGIAVLEPNFEFWAGECKPVHFGEELFCNGRLIAAAPRLLKACECAEAMLDRKHTKGDLRVLVWQLRAALAKAKGVT